MGWSPIAMVNMTAVDTTPPAEPTIALTQISKTQIQAVVTIPSLDVDGSVLEDLQEVSIGMATGVANPFIGISGGGMVGVTAQNAGGQAKTLFLDDGDIGTNKPFTFEIIQLGDVHYFAASVRDNSA